MIRAIVLTREVHVVVPGDIDDPASPSGGNTYDRRRLPGPARRRLDGARARGRRRLAAPRRRRPRGAGRRLAALPDGAVVLVDGLVACGVPEVVVPEARRLRARRARAPAARRRVGPARLAASWTRASGRSLRAAAAVVATSPWAARRLVALHGLDPARVHVAAPGVDPAPLAPGTDGGTALLCVGAVTPTQGAGPAGRRARRASPTCRGPARCVGPLARPRATSRRLRDAVARHGLGDRVRAHRPAHRRGRSTRPTRPPTCWCCRRGPRPTGWSSPRRWPAASRCSRATRAALPETLGRAPDGSVPGARRAGRSTPRRSPRRCAAGCCDPALRDRAPAARAASAGACCTGGR